MFRLFTNPDPMSNTDNDKINSLHKRLQAGVHIQQILNDHDSFSLAMLRCNKVGWCASNLLVTYVIELNATRSPRTISLANDITNWIYNSKFKLNRIRTDFKGDNYLPLEQLKKFMFLGYNPKVGLYQLTSKLARSLDDERKTLGTCYTQFADDFWFTVTDSICSKKCKQDSERYIPVQTFRVPLLDCNIIGTGGYGKVYKNELHGKTIAVKTIDITDNYRKHTWETVADENIYEKMTGNISVEAVLQGQMKHKYILPVIEHWFQCHSLTTIELVIATPLCLMNLHEWLDSKPFNFKNITLNMIQMCEGKGCNHVVEHRKS